MPAVAPKKTATVSKKPIAKTVPKAQITKAKSAPEPEPVAETPSETIVTPGGSRVRREVNIDTVDAEFTSLLELVQAEITATKGTKFLRGINKRLGVLQKDVRRVTKQKRRNAGTASPNSGFLKSSKISNELADFLGLERGSELSRVEATKGLHQYIVQNELQNPKNRREINSNKALTKLLGYKTKDCIDHTPAKNGEPKNPEGKLYYFVMQKLIQRHFE